MIAKEPCAVGGFDMDRQCAGRKPAQGGSIAQMQVLGFDLDQRVGSPNLKLRYWLAAILR